MPHCFQHLCCQFFSWLIFFCKLTFFIIMFWFKDFTSPKRSFSCYIISMRAYTNEGIIIGFHYKTLNNDTANSECLTGILIGKMQFSVANNIKLKGTLRLFHSKELFTSVLSLWGEKLNNKTITLLEINYFLV